MKTLGLTPLAAALLLVSSLTVSYAQGSDVAPDQKGATGWSGGARDQPSQPGGDKAAAPADAAAKPAETTGRTVEVHDEALVKDQPLMATGEDLKGPPAQFAPSKTPE
jgi:hypothetical protein